jgi:ectoine hydroxylase-related dioxygenase (phytanoyl-CoA dioxygenase family)
MHQPSPSAVTYTIHDFAENREVEISKAELRHRFERDGVVVMPGFLAEAQMLPLRRELDAHDAPLASKAATSHNGAGILARFECDVMVWAPLSEDNAAFVALNEMRKLAEVTEALLDSGYSTNPNGLVMYSVGGGRGQAWHQDCPPSGPEGKEFNLNRLIYTDDVALADGAIVFVPGSHRMGRIPSGGHQETIEGEVALEPRAGTVVFLHGHVYHRVTPNLNMKPRTSINLRAYPAGIDSDVNCIGVYRNGDVNFCETFKQHDGKPVELVANMR